MQGYTRILSVGHDHHLLSLRSIILRREGFDVIEAYSASDALRLAQSDAVDLVLVCQTLPKQEQRAIISAIRKSRRLMPILCVIANSFVLPAEERPDATHRPQQLLDGLHRAVLNYSSYRPNLAA
jgi:DNA-binding NtrC family response regulator